MGDKPHKRLKVWGNAIELACKVYDLTNKFPKSEIYGLISQMRRSVVSIASNIAEGAARHTKKEFRMFLHNAQGSLSELDTQAIIANRLGFIFDEDFRKLEAELDAEDKMLTGLIKSVNRKQ